MGVYITMFIRFYIFSILCILSSFQYVMANELGGCIFTPEIWTVGVLPKTASTNNLTQDYKSFDTASGKQIIIKGKVLDRNCVPIAGAKVSIWQADARGLYKFHKNDKKAFDPHFSGSGSNITDNLGAFEFFSVFPGFSNNINPNVVFKVEHSNFNTLETRMFFPAYNNAKSARSLNNSISGKEITLLIAKNVGEKNNQLIYYFVMTLKQSNFYKEY